MLPSPDLFIYAFVRKEAVLSSQIEGVQATLVDLFTQGGGDTSTSADVREVCNYVDTLGFIRKQLSSSTGLPLSLRLFRAAHKHLMKGVRGQNKHPGEFRSSQVWIGGTRPGNAVFVPPPPERIVPTLDSLEKYLHAENDTNPLIRAGLVHVQFETIHPFLDGNGRLGRLLITLLLEHWKVLSAPTLYLSLYFKRHREEYYQRLNAVRTDGDWDGWNRFFLEGVRSIALEATDSAQRLYGQFETDRRKLLDRTGSTLASVRLMERLPTKPIVTIADAVRLLETTKPTATKAVLQLVDAGILKETTGRRRDRTFAYRRYLTILSEGTELAG
jgi:Fic family protein